MNVSTEWHLAEFIGTGIGMGNLPVVVLRKAEEIFEELNKWEIREWYTGYRQQMKLWEYCLEHGHKITKATSNITPDHGTEYLHCGRCGNEETIHWY